MYVEQGQSGKNSLYQGFSSSFLKNIIVSSVKIVSVGVSFYLDLSIFFKTKWLKFSLVLLFFFFKQKTAYEISECDWSSDVCSSDLSIKLFVSSWDDETYNFIE